MDRIPPMVMTTMPDSGETNVAIDAKIVILFTEEVRDFGLDQKIMLSQADSLNAVPFEVESDETDGDNTVTLTPSAPLKPGTPYQVTITPDVTDTVGNKLPDTYRWLFSTVGYDESGYAEMALKFAPVVYQEVDPDGGVGRSDYFGAVDFDDDLDANNNVSTYRNVTFPAQAYYSVLETTTHYFVQYLFYYPSNYNDNTDRTGAHDVTATQVVLAKSDAGAPTFLMAESSASGEPYFGFAVEGSGISERGQGALELTFPASEMWDTTHYLAYHGRHFHGSCHWNWSPSAGVGALAPWCNHEAGSFLSDLSSIAFYPAQEGQIWTEANCSQNDRCAAAQDISCESNVCSDANGTRALTYGLKSFFEELWSRRVALSASTNLFGPRSVYAPHPDGEDRPGRGESRAYPASLATDNGGTSRGKMPFSWASNGSVSDGQWWVDPAWSFSLRFSIAGGEFGQDYCFNPYFDIDRRGEEGCEQ